MLVYCCMITDYISVQINDLQTTLVLLFSDFRNPIHSLSIYITYIANMATIFYARFYNVTSPHVSVFVENRTTAHRIQRVSIRFRFSCDCLSPRHVEPMFTEAATKARSCDENSCLINEYLRPARICIALNMAVPICVRRYSDITEISTKHK